MKKEYVKPQLEAIQLGGEVLMQSTSVLKPENGDNYGGDDAGANAHRGSWGNLWSEGE